MPHDQYRAHVKKSTLAIIVSFKIYGGKWLKTFFYLFLPKPGLQFTDQNIWTITKMFPPPHVRCVFICILSHPAEYCSRKRGSWPSTGVIFIMKKNWGWRERGQRLFWKIAGRRVFHDPWKIMPGLSKTNSKTPIVFRVKSRNCAVWCDISMMSHGPWPPVL